MLNKQRNIFFLLIGLVILWFFYQIRGILSPFILAAVFAYLFNPVITFVSQKTKVPRFLAILIIYGFLIGLFVYGTLSLSSRVFEESTELRSYASNVLVHAKTQLAGLPDWARPTARQLLTELQKSRLFTFFNTPQLFPFVSQAISRIISFLIFLFSGYYFLEEGDKMFNDFFGRVPEKYQKEAEDLLKKIHRVLGGYLRGQVFLIFLMGLVTYIALSIVGIQFAASIAIFSGFAEIVPIVGPISAATVAALVAFITGHAHFGLSPFNSALVVIVIYFVLRHLEDYFAIPHVMGSITKLPPFVIFFAVVVGGHLAGILGLILAVPTAAIIKILYDFTLSKLAED